MNRSPCVCAIKRLTGDSQANSCLSDMSIDASYEACSAAAEHIRRALGEPCAPKFGIICGSGLGETISSRLQNPRVLPYSGIPGFPACTG